MAYITDPFGLKINQGANYFTQKNFNGANYIQGERPILNIILEITSNNKLPGLDGDYYIYKITFDNTITIFVATIITPGANQADRGSFRGDTTPGITVNQIYARAIVDISGTAMAFTFQIVFDKDVPINKCLYKKGDTYVFSTYPGFLIPIVNPTMDIKFIRSNQTDQDDSCVINKSLSFFNENQINIPSININFKSLIDGSDIGNTIFKINDNVNYYNNKTTPIINSNNCKIITTNNPIETIFDQSCPLIVSVLKGNGTTAWEKTLYLFQNYKININDVYNFFINLVKYSMLKYLLSRIMYGKFNIKYIKYNNKKFLNDLKNTRFCKFVDLFTNPNSDIFGYHQYFL